MARWPNIALVIPSDPSHDEVVDAMFAGFGPEPTSKEIIRAINTLLAENRLRSVGMVVEATGGPMAVAFGDIEILVDGSIALSGVDGLSKEQISGRAESLTIRAANLPKAEDAVPPFDLRRGVAPGGGLSMPRLAAVEPPSLSAHLPGHADPEAQVAAAAATAGAAAAAASAVDGAADAPAADAAEQSAEPAVAASPMGDEFAHAQAMEAPFRSVLLTDLEPRTDVTPLPIAGNGVVEGEEAVTAAKLDRGRVEVEGILCSRGHFNNPQAVYCMVCGMSLAHLTPNRVSRPRPTLGFIVFDDGSSFGLDRSYLIGREPIPADEQDVELLVIHDNNDTLSRTHAELRLVDWSVQLIDTGSTNGTYIWDQENERWNQLTAGHAVELQSGETVALGRRTFVFEGVGQPG